MEKLEKWTGESTDPKYLRVKEVPKIVGVQIQAIYKAMRSGRLKFLKVPTRKGHPKSSGFVLVTTHEWIKEWRAQVNDKQIQRFNGDLMYNPMKGEMSTMEVCEYLGWSKNRLMHYLHKGHIKHTRKGYYYIFYKEDVDNFVERHQEMLKAI